MATLSTSEQISLWKLFEKTKVNSKNEREPFFEDGERADLQGIPTSAVTTQLEEETLRLRLERLDA